MTLVHVGPNKVLAGVKRLKPQSLQVKKGEKEDPDMLQQEEELTHKVHL